MATLTPMPHMIPATSPQPHSGRSSSASNVREAYFTPSNIRSTPRTGNSPSEGLSPLPCLSPSISQPSGTDRSSDCSASTYDSNELLSPPLSQPDSDRPPYKAKNSRSSSLTMSSKINDRAQKERARKSRRRSQKYKSGARRATQTGTAPANHQEGDKDLLANYHHLPPKHPAINTEWLDIDHAENTGAVDIFSQDLSTGLGRLEDLISAPAAPVATARWSSISLGSQDIPHVQLPASTDTADAVRNKTWTLGSPPADVIQAVRARLTFRKVPIQQLETPTSITLRRASSQLTSGTRDFLVQSLDIADHLTPDNNKRHQDSRSLAAYLITSNDIESIMSLIEQSFQSGTRHSQLCLEPYGLDLWSINGYAPRRPSITTKGVILSPSPPQRSLTLENVHREPKVTPSVAEPRRSGARKASTASKTNPNRNIHEVIWKGRGSPDNSSSSSRTPPENEKAFEADHFSTSKMNESRQANRSIARPAQLQKKNIFLGFSPNTSACQSTQRSTNSKHFRKSPSRTSRDSSLKNADNPIFRWSWDVSNRDSAGDLVSTTRTTNTESAITRVHHNPLVTPTTTQQDVVSFPPLPNRQETTDWISPLPDMNSIERNGGTSLWSFGIDAHTGDKIPRISPPITDQSPTEKTGQELGADTEKHVEFSKRAKYHDESHLHHAQTPAEQKSVILEHPFALHRTGETFKLGSAIGSSTGTRRKSSLRALQIKLEHQEVAARVDDRKPWAKPRKDSGWPTPKSISPASVSTDRLSSAGTITSIVISSLAAGNGHRSSISRTPSPERELEIKRSRHSSSDRSLGLVKARSMEAPGISGKRKSVAVEQLSLIEERSPPLPRQDYLGIDSFMNGTTAATTAKTDDRKSANGGHSGCEIDHRCGELPSRSRGPSVDWIS